MNSKSQTISMDALIAVALFMVAVILFFTLSGSSNGEKRAEGLQTESGKALSSVSSSMNSTDTFLKGSKIDQRKLDEISGLGYSDLKNVIGISSDFCIHFEDEQGNIVNISGNKTGLGSSMVRIAGVACG
jgi:hypothetical protein